MSGVRVLVGTRKGAFVLRSDGLRKNWDVSGPFFGGWEMYHLKVHPSIRIVSTLPRERAGSANSSNARTTAARRGSPLATSSTTTACRHAPVVRRHTSPVGVREVWHLEPSLSDPDAVLAGVEDAALFQSTDGGENWSELSGLRKQDSGASWQPGAGGMCLHSIIVSPKDPERIFVAISSAGAFRTDDGGKSWRPINKGLHSEGIPDGDAEVGTAFTTSRCTLRSPTRCSCRSTGT